MVCVCEIGWISASIGIGVQFETLEAPECVRAETIDPLPAVVDLFSLPSRLGLVINNVSAVGRYVAYGSLPVYPLRPTLLLPITAVGCTESTTI